MTYELAKKLKDAGFPQYTAITDEPTSYVHIPTLEELIDACGDKFDCLGRMEYPKGENLHWNAYRTEESYDGDCVADCCGYETGNTPSEAVANLWLALHNKEVT